jgi:hypothetical protein
MARLVALPLTDIQVERVLYGQWRGMLRCLRCSEMWAPRGAAKEPEGRSVPAAATRMTSRNTSRSFAESNKRRRTNAHAESDPTGRG